MVLYKGSHNFIDDIIMKSKLDIGQPGIHGGLVGGRPPPGPLDKSRNLWLSQ